MPEQPGQRPRRVLQHTTGHEHVGGELREQRGARRQQRARPPPFAPERGAGDEQDQVAAREHGRHRGQHEHPRARPLRREHAEQAEARERGLLPVLRLVQEERVAEVEQADQHATPAAQPARDADSRRRVQHETDPARRFREGDTGTRMNEQLRDQDARHHEHQAPQEVQPARRLSERHARPFAAREVRRPREVVVGIVTQPRRRGLERRADALHDGPRRGGRQRARGQRGQHRAAPVTCRPGRRGRARRRFR
jgi:hypothetical protein